MTLAEKGCRYQLNQYEDTVIFPDDEIRHHDDRTGKYCNNILGVAVNEEDSLLPGYEEEPENTEDLGALATENRTLRDARENSIRYGCHMVTSSATSAA